MSENSEEKKESIKINVPPDLDYSYRDYCKVYIGQGEVLLEFGNTHHSMPGNISISNRIVLTTSNAFALQETLQKALQAASLKLQQQLQKK